MAYLCNIPNASDGADYVDDGHGHELGECVSLVKRMCPRVPVTKFWKKGSAVKGNVGLLSGTAIASFDPKTGHYWHAAIYVRQDGAGIWVWDQYHDGPTRHPPKLNQLRWENNRHPRVAGDNFYVIE